MTIETYKGWVIHYKRRNDLYHDFSVDPFEYYIKEEEFRNDLYTEYHPTREQMVKHGYEVIHHRSQIFDTFADAQEEAIRCLKRDRQTAELLIADIDKSLGYHCFMGAGI